MDRLARPVRPEGAFSLLELLTAMLILGILITVLTFNANATQAAMTVRGGWIELAQAQNAERAAAAANPPDYFYPAWTGSLVNCDAQLASGALSPATPGLSFLYECPSTGTDYVSLYSPNDTTVYMTLLAAGSSCLIEVDHLTGSNGGATTYGVDAALKAAGDCNAQLVSGVVANVTSTDPQAPSNVNGQL